MPSGDRRALRPAALARRPPERHDSARRGRRARPAQGHGPAAIWAPGTLAACAQRGEAPSDSPPTASRRRAAAGRPAPATAASIPSHMTGATRAAASTLAGRRRRHLPKWAASSGAVPGRRGDRDGRASARPAAPRRRRAGAPRGLASTQQRHDGGEAELPAGVVRGARVERQRGRRGEPSAYQRDGGRPAPRPTPAAPMTAARWIDGPAPGSGT